MGCYTWFYNRTKDIPNKHLAILKKKIVKDEKQHCQYPTFKDWIDSETDEDLIYDYQLRMNMALQNNDELAIEYYRKQINKALDPAHRGYKKSEWKKYWNRRKKIKRLLTQKIHKNELLSILKYELILFNNDYYELGDTNEFCNTFRIYDYDAEPWYCLDDFIQYIQEHPNCVWRYKYNENNERIKYNGKEAEDEAIAIVKDFFTKYPNGKIRLG